VQKVKEKLMSHSLPKVLCDLIVNILIVYITLFGQAVLSMFCVAMCVYSEQLAHALRRFCLLFCS